MQTKTNCLLNHANKVGLFIKTEVVRANCDRKAFAHRDRFTCLGSDDDGDCSIDTKNKLGKAWGAFQKLTKIGKMCTSKGININTQNISTAMIYLCFFIALKRGKNGGKSTQTSFQNRCLCRLLNIKWTEFITNEEVLKRANPIKSTILKRRWRYLDHVLRMPPTRTPK